MSQLNVDTVRNRTGTNGGPTFDKGLTVSAGTTAYVYGNLQVDGTETIINTETLNVADKTIGIGSTSNASNTTADGAGIEVYAGSGGNKTITWNNTGNTWTFAPTDVTVTVGSGVTLYGDTGIVSATTLRADTLYGNGANLTGMASTEYIDAASITVSGIATCNGVLDANAEVTAAGGVDVAGGVKVGAALTVVGALDVDGVTTLDVLTAAEEVKVGSAVTIGTAGVSTFSNGVNLAPGTGLLREKFSSTTTAWSNNNTDLNLDNGMVQYSSGNLGGSSSTLNITSSVGINTQMAVGEMIIVTGITSCNSTSSYVNALKIDHTTVQVAWVGGSAPSDGGGSGFDTYTFNIWKTASATYNVIGNHVKTS